MKKLALLATLAVFGFSYPNSVYAQTTQDVGKWRHHDGHISFSVKRDGESFVQAIMFASDEHVYDSVLYQLTEKELEQLRDMINKTLEEMK